MTWLTATYFPVSLFSLRPHNATTSGGKTLLAPTAFAIKMALLAASIQTQGVEEGRRRFPSIRDLRIALDLPQQIVVVKSFAKIQRPIRLGSGEARDTEIAEALDVGHYPFAPTIAYRELVQFDGTLRLGCTMPNGEVPHWLADTLLAINYFGKRGSFVQIAGRPQMSDTLADTFTDLTSDSAEFRMDGTLQMLDDCGPSMTFDHADIYSPKRISLGKERIIRHVVLPYRLTRSSRGYSLFERLAESMVRP